MNFIEDILAAVGVADATWLEVIHAREAAVRGNENALGEVSPAGDGQPETSGEGMKAVEGQPWRAPVPTAPLIVSQLNDRETTSAVKLWLRRYYPEEHLIQLIYGTGTGNPKVRSLPLQELDPQKDIDEQTALFVPPLKSDEDVRTFAGLMNLTRTLRAPEGCPWDREQTHESLKPHLLEETYEVLEALDANDPEMLADELGDLLFQVTIHSQVAAEADEFTIEDVIERIMRKLIGRHPHVFGEMHFESAQEVRHNWEALKQQEKPDRASVLEEIPRGLPALPQSNLMQKRAASVGFEWPSFREVIEKCQEELEELGEEVRLEGSKERLGEEYGDILFALVSVGRYLKIDPEEALRAANRKFEGRFRFVEARVKEMGKGLRELSARELDEIWEEGKRDL